MQRPYVYWLAPPRIGGLDVLVPLLCELRASDTISGCCVLIEDEKSIRMLPKNQLLHSLLHENADRVWPFFTQTSGSNAILHRMSRLMMLARLFGGVMARRKVVFIHACKQQRSMVSALARLVRARGGRTLFHPASMTLPSPGAPVDLTGVEADTLVVFADGGYKMRPDQTLCSLGYPRVFNSWKVQVERWVAARDSTAKFSAPSHKSHADIHKAKNPLIVVFMSSTVERVFSEADHTEWIDQLGRTLHDIYPGARVVIKPHPLSARESIAHALTAFSGLEVSVINEHPSALCILADIIVTPHSTVVIDALASGKPTVGFQKTDEKWLARHPDGSRYLKFCSLWAKTEDELKGALRIVKNGQYRKPDLSKLLGDGDARANFADIVTQ